MKDNFTNNTVQEDTKNPLLDSLLNRYFKDRESANILVSNTKYILWLEHFTTKYPSFCSEQCFSPEELSDDDLENVDSLPLFLEGITNYASKNFLPITPITLGVNSGYYVLIKFNGIGYMLSVKHIQVSYNYCSRVDISSDKNFIDFNDIMNSTKQKHVDFVLSKLNELSNLLNDMLASGVPESEISSVVDSAIEKHQDMQ